ncbi:MAG: 4-hydroxy-tetrahydrodipicolinate reductase [Nitriliruptorales bacterium]
MVRVGVLGAAGRMGSTVCAAVDAAADLDLVAQLDEGDSLDLLEKADTQVTVDFTTPDAVGSNVAWLLEHGIHAVVGTTGWSDDDLARWRRLAEEGPANAIVAPNFALGAVLMIHLARIVAPHLPDVEIIELHHDGKADAPSGTALMTADVIADARRETPDVVLGEKLDGARGADRSSIRVHALRLPGLVAHQEVIFGGTGQTLSVRHDTVDRTAFMPGVLLAIREVAERPGLTLGLDRLLGLEAST